MKAEPEQTVDKMSIPFVTSDGDISRLYLPKKMSVADAKRLKRMINALYINQQINKSSGSSPETGGSIITENEGTND